MPSRRFLLLTVPAALALGVSAPAWAQNAQQAAAFIDTTGKELTAVVNGPGSTAEKQQKLQAIVDRVVDVNGVARFCLGRFWRTATPEQQQQYLQLFHRVLMVNITGKIGEYQGVTFAIGRAVPREGAMAVNSTVTRPGNPPSKVEWLVSNETGGPKIIDVIAEGVSLRQTQRSDYLAYLSHNNNNVQALINAMKQQASQQG